MDFDRLPGGTRIRQGLADLALGHDTEDAWLVRVGAPRLRRLGLPIPGPDPPGVEHRLYQKLQDVHGESAHSRYNALIRLLVSFERAAECDR